MSGPGSFVGRVFDLGWALILERPVVEDGHLPKKNTNTKISRSNERRAPFQIVSGLGYLLEQSEVLVARGPSGQQRDTIGLTSRRPLCLLRRAMSEKQRIDQKVEEKAGSAE